MFAWLDISLPGQICLYWSEPYFKKNWAKIKVFEQCFESCQATKDVVLTLGTCDQDKLLDDDSKWSQDEGMGFADSGKIVSNSGNLWHQPPSSFSHLRHSTCWWRQPTRDQSRPRSKCDLARCSNITWEQPPNIGDFFVEQHTWITKCVILIKIKFVTQ